MGALALMLRPIAHGWAVTLTDGRELVRFTGLGARLRVLRYLATHDLGREASHVTARPGRRPWITRSRTDLPRGGR